MNTHIQNKSHRSTRAANADVADIIMLFDGCFSLTENTVLIGEANEPLYLPGNNQVKSKVIFTRDYFSSALHEIAHWCIAGRERRKRIDYGYWYYPDGRNADQQKAFESVEDKPQAIEFAFSIACNIKFQVSKDNLMGESDCNKNFERTVLNQLITYIEHGFPPRAEIFLNNLHRFYGTSKLRHSSCIGVEIE